MGIEAIRNTIRSVTGGGPARAVAITNGGSDTFPVPSELLDLITDPVDIPFALDVVDAAYYGQTVTAFHLAERNGSSTVRVVDDQGDTVDLTLVAAADLGCTLAILVPAESDVTVEHEATTLVPRRFTWTSAATGEVLTVDDSMCRRLGWDRSDVVGRSTLWLVHPDAQDRSVKDWGELLGAPGSMIRSKKRFRTSDGEWVWCEATYHNRLADPDHRHVVVEAFDISEEMEAQESLRDREELLGKLAEALPAGILHLDMKGRARFANTRWHEITGIGADASIDDLCDLVTEPADLREMVLEAVRADIDCDIEVTLCSRADSAVEFASLRVRPLEGRTPQARSVLLVLDDITAERHRRANLTAAAVRDPLTGVLNRAGLVGQLGEMLVRRDPVTVLFCDLDGLKRINDEHGHAAGDGAIIGLASALTQVVRAGDVVGRLGGDEFVVALPTDNQDFIESVVEEIADRLLLVSADSSLPLRCSIGVAAREPGDDFEALLGRADTQMYRIKELRRRTPV